MAANDNIRGHEPLLHALLYVYFYSVSIHIPYALLEARLNTGMRK